MLRTIFLAVLAVFAAVPAAFAQCPDLTVLACDMENGARLTICADESRITYFHQLPDSPEIKLENPLGAPGYTPWPGVSRTIWDSVAFADADLTYEVVTSIERLFPDQDDADVQTVRHDTLLISEFGDLVDELSCRPETVTGHVGLLHDHLTAKGLCWDTGGFRWAACG